MKPLHCRCSAAAKLCASRRGVASRRPTPRPCRWNAAAMRLCAACPASRRGAEIQQSTPLHCRCSPAATRQSAGFHAHLCCAASPQLTPQQCLVRGVVKTPRSSATCGSPRGAASRRWTWPPTTQTHCGAHHRRRRIPGHLATPRRGPGRAVTGRHQYERYARPMQRRLRSVTNRLATPRLGPGRVATGRRRCARYA